MVIIGRSDHTLSAALVAHSWSGFAAFQDRSLFEDGAIGGSDFGLLFQMCSVLIFLVQMVSDRTSVLRPGWRRVNAAVALSALHIGLLVQGLKFGWARARPYSVSGSESELYSPWYLPGHLTFARGDFNGSFPSGHCAAAAAFFAILLFVPKGFRKWAVVHRWCALALALLSWGAMILARTMSKAHYLTDGLASGLVVVLSLALFAYVFEIDQDGSMHRSLEGSEVFRKARKLFLCSIASLLVIFLVRLAL
jgi:membrane-associated phospholipid phosphatase